MLVHNNMTQHGDASDTLRGQIKLLEELSVLPEVLQNIINKEKETKVTT